jgi:tryptophan-rich sensory protein
MDQIQAYMLSFIIMLFVVFIPSGAMKSINTPWYQCIKPTITPPNYVFPIVWTILYITLGIGLSKTLLLEDSNNKNILLILYAINLILNISWSLVYFGNRNILFAFFIIIGLIISHIFILNYTKLLLPNWVFLMLIPYIIWISFAALLNYLSIKKSTNCVHQ